MSGFYLLALFALWLFVGWIIYHFWKSRRPENLFQRIVHIVTGILLLSAWFGGAFWEVTGQKMYWDAKVREMCAKDGGVKVYETVILPAERFDKYGNVHIPSKSFAKPTDEYYYESENRYFQKGNADQTGNPDVFQYNFRIVRHQDGKIMGESINYIRRGGGLPGPWHPSSFSCPENSDPSRLIFKSQEKNQ